MRKLLSLAALFIAIGANSQTIPYVVLNELNVDNPGGPDNAEFIELYGAPGTLLDSLTIVLYDGNSDQSYAAFDLDGYSLDENGFFVMGNGGAVDVDYVIPNATIQNGQDGIGIYYAEAIYFPNGTPATSNDLIDGQVYSTGDALDPGLIAAMGLDIFVPGYIQLDETAQQAGADLSLSRIPDGGAPFDYMTYVLQAITPGTFNTPQCLAGAIQFSETNTVTVFCDNLPSAQVSFHPDAGSYGDTSFYAICDAGDLIMNIIADSSYDFAGMPVGDYRIYSVFHNGEAIATSLEAGMPVSGIQAGNCVSLSENYLGVSIVACGGCIGGEITADQGSILELCTYNAGTILLDNTSTSQDASYSYIVTDTNDLIVQLSENSLDLSLLGQGAYRIYGISYAGELDALTIEIGDTLQQVTASLCQELSSNFIEINLYDCAVQEACASLLISEYLEGNNGTKAIELFNPTLSEVSLDGYTLLLYSNGATTPTATLALSGSLGPLAAYVIANPGTQGGNGQASPAVLALADITDVVANFSGNDALELRFNDQIIDVIGIVGQDPGTTSGWPVGSVNTRDVDMVRKYEIQSPVNVWAVSSQQWDTYDNTDYTHLGSHLFDACSDQVIAGFLGSSVTVNENAGNIILDIQCINVSDSVSIVVSISGGSADGSDFTSSLPDTLTFTAGSLVQSVTLSIINDLIAEPSENIVITLSSEVEIFWTSQTLEITINQSDPNCDGGFIINAAGNQPVTQCSDLANSPIDVSANTNFPSSGYLFVITNANDSILSYTDISPIDMDGYGAGTYHIWGLSYTGLLDDTSIEVNDIVDGINADTCASLSQNFITVNRTPCIITGCDGGSVSLEDGATLISVCALENDFMLIPSNTGQSVDDSYTYFLTDANDNILEEIDGSYSTLAMTAGEYHIWGLSYTGTIDATSVASGLPVSGALSDGCTQTSTDFIQIMVYDCVQTAPCTELYFSEYLEDTQSNKAFEIYNPTPFSVDLSEYTVLLFENGSPTPTQTLNCEGILASHNVFVVASSGNGQNPTDPIILAAADTTHPVATFTGNDAIYLVHFSDTTDVIGIAGDNPGQGGWPMGNSSTANHDHVRRPEITSPNNEWEIVSGQWISFTPDIYENLGWHIASDCGFGSIPSLSFTNVNQFVNENSAVATVYIEASNVETPFDVTINAAGSATMGSDYGSTFPLIVNVPVGTTTLYFDITIFGDGVSEGDETIILSMASSTIVNYGISMTTVVIQDFVSVEEVADTRAEIYPNPARDQANIRCASKIEEVRVMDLSGRIIESLAIKGGKNQVTIDTSSLSAGYYPMVIISESGIHKQNLMIIR